MICVILFFCRWINYTTRLFRFAKRETRKNKKEHTASTSRIFEFFLLLLFPERYAVPCVCVCAKERKMCTLSPYVPLLDAENCSHADFFFESLRHDDEMNLTDITWPIPVDIKNNNSLFYVLPDQIFMLVYGIWWALTIIRITMKRKQLSVALR